MKGDRFDQQCRKTYSTDFAPVVAEALRKQHNAVRRMVKKHKKVYISMPRSVDGDAAYRNGLLDATSDILAALDKRAKGGTK